MPESIAYRATDNVSAPYDNAYGSECYAYLSAENAFVPKRFAYPPPVNAYATKDIAAPVTGNAAALSTNAPPPRSVKTRQIGLRTVRLRMIQCRALMCGCSGGCYGTPAHSVEMSFMISRSERRRSIEADFGLCAISASIDSESGGEV